MKQTTRSLTIVILGLFTLTGQPATLTVSNLNDNGPGSLRQAVVDASSGDTINFGVTGAIVLTSDMIVLDKNLIIQGTGTNQTLVNGNRLFRAFDVAPSATISMSDLTVTNAVKLPEIGGFDDNGGGVRNRARSR